ncbi:hypothetical protein D3C85_999530 [compost metagenome]
MQPAALPELGALFGLVQIALRQPGGAHHDLALGHTVVRYVVAVGIDDSHIDHRHRNPRPDPHGQLGVHRLLEVFGSQVGGTEQGTGFGHPIPAVHVNALFRCLPRYAQCQGTAAEKHFPAIEAGPLRFGAAQDHLQDGGHAVGEGHLLFAVEPDQAIGLVSSGIDLLDAHQGRDVGHAPGMHMEHRRDRHVDIVGAQRGYALVRTQGADGVQGMQHQLAVGEIDALRVSGSPRGVEESRYRPFVEIGEVVLARGLR